MELDRRRFLQGALASGALVAGSGLFGCAPKGSATEVLDETDETSWRAKPEEPSNVASTEEADIIIIGAGNSGLTAAASALDRGASVIILESENDVQASRSWIGAIDSNLQKEAGVSIDKNEAVNNICRFASYTNDQRLVRKWADNSGEFMDWFIPVMESQDLHVMLETACKDSVYYNKEVAHHVYKGEYNPEGPNDFYHHTQALKSHVLSKGGDIRFQTPGALLAQDETGKVTGVYAKTSDDSYILFNAAKGVVVATGGFGNNEEMLDELTTMAHRYCSTNAGGERNVGMGMKMLIWAGAQLHPIQETMVFDRGTVMPGTELGFPFSGGLWYGGSQPWLRVNEHGQRFFNEDQTYDYCFNAAVVQPGHTWWEVFDANYYADCMRFQTARCSRVAMPAQGNAPMICYLDGTTKLDETFLANFLQQMLDSEAAVKADSLEDLAEAMGVPPQAFAQTVARNNELWDKQSDEDFGKKATRLNPIKEGPFYAVHCAGWLLCTIGGVTVTPDLQPMREDGTPIEGVYVIGNDQGGFCSTVYPETFGGLQNGKGMTFGYLTGKALATS